MNQLVGGAQNQTMTACAFSCYNVTSAVKLQPEQNSNELEHVKTPVAYT